MDNGVGVAAAVMHTSAYALEFPDFFFKKKWPMRKKILNHAMWIEEISDEIVPGRVSKNFFPVNGNFW